MPRPSDPHARARLLDAARAVFSDRGLDRAKVEDITTRAQLSKGAFYLHFQSKEEAFKELLAGVVSQLERMLDESADEQLAMAPGDVRTIELYLRTCHEKDVEIFEFIWENRALMALVLDGGGSASYQHLIEDFAQRAQRQTAVLLEHGTKLGLYRTDFDADVAAAFLAGGFDRLARTLVRQTRKPDIEAMISEAEALFLGGLAKRDVLDVLKREGQKLSGKQAVERGDSGVGRGAITG